MTRPEPGNAMCEAIVHTLESPHILANDAVIQNQPWTSVLEQSIAVYESQFHSSILQNVLMAKAFDPEMLRNRHGRFIAISTKCVMQHFSGQSAYVAGKRSMDEVLRVLVKEIGPYQITVNQMAPGWTITERLRHEGTPRQGAFESAVPLRRRGKDQEIANVVAFLASDLEPIPVGS